MLESPRRLLRWSTAAIVLLTLPLLFHALNGANARYVGDDYCAAAVFQDEGIAGGQVWFYRYWGAIPSTVALMAATHHGDVAAARVLPAIVLALWVGAAAWSVAAVSRSLGYVWSGSVTLLVALLIVFVTIETAPNVGQSLYLRVPMLAYTAPLVLATWYVGLLSTRLARAHVRRRDAALSAAVAFVAGAFGPVFVAGQTAALSIAAGIAWATRRTPATLLLGSGVLGSVAALAFVALAPGNSVRQQLFPAPPDPLTIIVWSVLYAAFMFARPVLPALDSTITAVAPTFLGATPRWLDVAMGMSVSPLLALLPLLVSAVLVITAVRPDTARGLVALSSRVLVWTVPVTFALVVACMAPGAYGTSTPPPPRALIIPGFVMVCGAAVFGAAAGIRLLASGVSASAARPLAAVTVIALLWSAGSAMLAAQQRAGELQAWAARWDETDRQLRQARAVGEMNPVVPAVGSVAGVGSIAASPDDWVNICAARYYDLQTITGTPSR